MNSKNMKNNEMIHIMEKQMRSFILACSFVFAFSFIPTSKAMAENKNLTMDECLKMTLDYSRDILLAREGMNISEGRYIEERAAAFPYIGTETSIKRYRDESIEKSGLPPAFSQILGIPSPNLEQSEMESKLTLAQPVFTWGQVSAAINAAKFDMKASELKLHDVRQLALRESATVFYGLLLAIELEKTAKDSVEQKKRHLDEAERKYKMEVATDYDVLAARVALTNAEPDLTKAKNSIRLLKDRVRYFTGLEGDFEAKGTLVCDIKKPEGLEKVIEEAGENRPDVKYYKTQVETFSELVKVAKGSNKPRLDIKGELGMKKYVEQGEDYPGKNWNAGLYLTFPLFDGLRGKGQVMQAESRVTSYEIELKKLEDQILLDARQSINDVNEAIEIVKSLEATTVQADRLLKMAEAGYKFGVKTKLEVDDAESNLLNAKINLASARHDYLVAMTRLNWVMGRNLKDSVPDTCGGSTGK